VKNVLAVELALANVQLEQSLKVQIITKLIQMLASIVEHAKQHVLQVLSKLNIFKKTGAAL
jgi:hypothetical protein